MANWAILIAAAALSQTPAPRPAGGEVFAIPVLTTVDSDMFPSSWTSGDINATAASLEPAEAPRSLEIIRKAMERYPADLLKRNLRRVYITSRLSFYGLPYGGTNSLDTLYLANRGRRWGFSDRYLEESFHHEFSSILLRNYSDRFDEDRWSATNGPQFTYRGDGTQAVREGTASTRYSPRYHEQGFLAQYATASIEEDFNMMAEGVFSGNPRFWQAVDQYPRLRAKMKEIVRFYGRLDKSFNEAKFRSFVPATASAESRDWD